MRLGLASDLDGVWNLVLACTVCNRGPLGKFDATPDKQYVARLHRRNEYLIGSHHPLRETLMFQTGGTRDERCSFLQEKLNVATTNHPGSWLTEAGADPAF